MSGGPYLVNRPRGRNSPYPYPLSVSWRGATNAPERIFMSGRETQTAHPRSGPGPDRSSNTRRAHRVGETKDGADANKEVGGEPVGPAVTCIPLYGGRVRIVHRDTHPMVQGRSTHRPCTQCVRERWGTPSDGGLCTSRCASR